MDIVTMEALMAQTNALPEESSLLEIYAEAAEEKVLDDTCSTLKELKQKANGEVPGRIIQAVLMLVGHWYRNRETTSTVQMYNVPFGYATLIKSFRQFKKDWRQ